MKNKTCCFTGHRKISKDEYVEIKKCLFEEIEKLISKGVCYFETGGALGFDTLAALAVLELRETHSHIKLILILPCKEQTRGWQEEDKKIYGQILSKADKTVYASENYFRGCMQKRNRNLVDESSFCICYLNKPVGGTAYTVEYAKKQGLCIINIAE